MVVLSQFCICIQKLGKDQLLKLEIRNPWRVLGRKSKNENYVTVLVGSANILYQTKVFNKLC